MKNFQRCSRCIMDNYSDPTITFDKNGYCNYCSKALNDINEIYFPGTTELGKGNLKLDAFINMIKEQGKGKKYDCIMGLSGGLDSSYLAYLGYKWGLRVLAVHIDDGFDTEISKSNLNKLVNATGFDYEVIVPDAEQFNDLTLAFMKAGVPNLAAPQDNVLFSFLYAKMKKYKIKYFLSGGNFALECILQQGNTHSAFDIINIKDINKKFGTTPLDKLELMSNIDRMIDRYLYRIKSPRPLNLIDYNRDRAFKELKEFCDFNYYGRKHLENILTAFVQLYWFPKKFDVDKRTSHLSSMIVSGQLTREEALEEYSKPLYDEKQMQEYINVIKTKFNISNEEFDKIMNAPSHNHTDYEIEERTFIFKSLRKVNNLKKQLFKRKNIN